MASFSCLYIGFGLMIISIEIIDKFLLIGKLSTNTELNVDQTCIKQKMIFWMLLNKECLLEPISYSSFQHAPSPSDQIE